MGIYDYRVETQAEFHSLPEVLDIDPEVQEAYLSTEMAARVVAVSALYQLALLSDSHAQADPELAKHAGLLLYSESTHHVASLCSHACSLAKEFRSSTFASIHERYLRGIHIHCQRYPIRYVLNGS